MRTDAEVDENRGLGTLPRALKYSLILILWWPSKLKNVAHPLHLETLTVVELTIQRGGLHGWVKLFRYRLIHIYYSLLGISSTVRFDSEIWKLYKETAQGGRKSSGFVIWGLES